MLYYVHRDIGQLGLLRLLREQETAGSNPAIPTKRPHRQAVKTSASQVEVPGSNPGGVTKERKKSDMSDEEYEKLKNALLVEEKRREKVREINLQIKNLEKFPLGLVKLNGWTRNMEIHIAQFWEQIGEDGPSVPKERRVSLYRDDVGMFMEALDILVENKKKQLEKLIEEAE